MSKFNVGDKIVLFKLDYFDNPYHYKKSVTQFTVKASDEKYFTPYYDEVPGMSGSNMFAIFSQETGRSLGSNRKAYHLVHDREEIDKLISEAVSEYDEMCRKVDEERIIKLEKTINNSKNEIEAIKRGGGVWKVGFNKYSHKKYKEKVMNYILSKLGNEKFKHLKK